MVGHRLAAGVRRPGRTPIEQFVFFDESMRAQAPVPMLTVNTVGPTIMQFGTTAQKEFFLPKIVAGEIHFCIGYSEPGAGTDLAALQTRAVRDGDEYIVNGRRSGRALASDADYCWLAVRTNAEAKKHKGISMIIVDMKNTDGITVRPLDSAAGPQRVRSSSSTMCACRSPIASARRTAAGTSSPISSTTNGSRCVSSGMIEHHLDEVKEWAKRQSVRRSQSDRRRMGAHRVGAAPTHGSSSCAHQLKVAYNATHARCIQRMRRPRRPSGTEFYSRRCAR
jgi:alkylation response protein AidB-like acyl-CoA dehydrogenase